MIQRVSEDGWLTGADLNAFVNEAFGRENLTNKRVLFVIPDATRSMPMPTLFRALHETLHRRVAKLDFLIALGTHPPMPEEAINKLVGISQQEREGKYRGVGLFNHEWQNRNALVRIGTLTEDMLADISGGLLRERVDVTINRRVLEYDLVCVVGPVFPHEVVG
ncbi:MAG: DUF2088 domain-containing protein, partial [Candidatus Hydrogenedentes bacterium]|nr:DUF2088 domain-containing protein [Candidatus Hydrogenedentota bacterium]